MTREERINKEIYLLEKGKSNLEKIVEALKTAIELYQEVIELDLAGSDNEIFTERCQDISDIKLFTQDDIEMYEWIIQKKREFLGKE